MVRTALTRTRSGVEFHGLKGFPGYLQDDYGAGRIAPGPSDLRAPLEFRWLGPGAMGPFLIGRDGRDAFWVAGRTGRERLLAYATNGDVRWQLSGSYSLTALLPSKVLVTREVRGAGRIQLLDRRTGAVCATGPKGYHAVLAALDGRMVIALHDSFRTIAGLDAKSLAVAWTVQANDGDKFDYSVAASRESCFVGAGNTVVALGLLSGERRWSTTFEPLFDDLRAGPFRPSVAGRVLLIGTGRGVAGLSTVTGQRLWSTGCAKNWTAAGGGVHMLVGVGTYVLADLQSGRVRASIEFEEERVRLAGRAPGYVSTTFGVGVEAAFFGDSAGRVWSLDRRRRKLFLITQVEGGMLVGPAVVAQDRLFLRALTGSDLDGHVLCLRSARIAKGRVTRGCS
jgi:hypothetical protein